MKRRVLALIAPPVAVCRYGCAACCAAPISVFWIAGMVSIIYAFFGGPAGPAEVEGFSSGTFLLGAILWGIASTWAELTIGGIDADDKCDKNSSTLCRVVKPRLDDSNPLDEIKKFQ